MDSVKIREMLVEHSAWLRGEDGRKRADLSGASLSYADLRGADLRGASLRGSDLSYASLRDADLSGANLRGSDLRGANLSGARLPDSIHGCVCRMDFGGWTICIYHDHTVIGCQRNQNESWLKWTPESPEIKEMHSGAAEWWQVHGEAIKAAIRCVMAKAAKYHTET